MNTTTKNPETLQEAMVAYADPEAALSCMMKFVWPNGPVCPQCHGKDYYFLKTRQSWKCKACHKQFTIKTGTIMEDSPLGLDKWLAAVWLLANAKNGISSYEVHRAIGVTQKTGWFLLQRIRLAMKQGSFTKMSGTVEADETYVGGKLRNFKKAKIAAMRKAAQKPGRPPNALAGTGGKAVVMGLLERGQDGKCSRIHATLIEGAKKGHVQEVVRAKVEPGSIVMTDTLPSYQSLQDKYIHMAINHAVEYAKGRIHTNGMENFWALLKRTIKGTYIAIEPFHMIRYLDEQSFRFNHRKEDDAGRFAHVLECISGKRLTYRALIGETTTTVCHS